MPPKIILDARKIEKHGSGSTAHWTTDEYWACDCHWDYIHPASQNVCKICDRRADDSTSAEILEIDDAIVGVRAVAKGYQWDCPFCNVTNNEIELPLDSHLECQECREIVYLVDFVNARE